MEIKKAKMTLLPAAPGTCQFCAVDHPPDAPHNAQSLYYQTRFQMEHGRGATWLDAVAHCEADIKQHWKDELQKLGHWTETDNPISEPPS